MKSELIQSAQSGNLEAYEKLIYTYRGTVERFAFQCGADWSDIPDISQEVFIRLYRFLHQFKEDRFTTWLYKMTVNTTRDFYRKKQQDVKKEEKWVTSHSSISFHTETLSIIKNEEDQELHAQIQQLDEKYRIPLVLFYFQECSYNEIAEILSINLATVKIRIYRAKDLLRTVYEEEAAKVYE